MTAVAVELPAGAVAVPFDLELPDARDGGPRAAVAIAHGAGAGREHPFLVGFAAALRARGMATARFDFPYRVAGRRMPGPAAHAIATWAAVFSALQRAVPDVPHVAAGKSYGGRMASMAAAGGEIAPDALVYLGYPLHAPGKPDVPRASHLPEIAAPQLFVSGTKDPFLQPLSQFEAVVATCRCADIEWVDGGGHSFEVAGVRRDAAEIGAARAASVADWIEATVIRA